MIYSSIKSKTQLLLFQYFGQTNIAFGDVELIQNCDAGYRQMKKKNPQQYLLTAKIYYVPVKLALKIKSRDTDTCSVVHKMSIKM